MEHLELLGPAPVVSYDRYGDGPPLVLVHGSFSDHRSNWEYAGPLLAERFCIHAIARRGRGETLATAGHGVEDEARDVASLILSLDQPVFLLGHSYGAQVAAAAAAVVPQRVRKLILYEPPRPDIHSPEQLEELERCARSRDWDAFTMTFFQQSLEVPRQELEELRTTPLWEPMVADAEASLGDIRALSRYRFDPERFHGLDMPVLLQIGTESPRRLFATDTFAAMLPDTRIEALEGAAHEGMNTAPKRFSEVVSRFMSCQ